MRFACFLSVGIFAFASSVAAEDWGATLIGNTVIPDLEKFAAGWEPGSATIPDAFGKRYVKAPGDGAIVGSGWDMVLNRKTFSTCIQAEREQKNFTDILATFNDVSDDETRDVALNANFNGNFGIGIDDVVSANASDKFGVEWNSHYNSKNRQLIARITAINGPEFVVPPGAKFELDAKFDPTNLPKLPTLSVKLTADAQKLREENPDKFRSECGDGFIGAIFNGAELVVRVDVLDVDQTSRQVFEHHGKADVNLFDIVKAGGGDDLSAVIKTAQKKNKLEVRHYQLGGSGSKPAADFASALEAYNNLPTQAANNPRPIYYVIYPYGELSSCIACGLPGVAKLKEQIVRYYIRLSGVYDQTREVKDNFQRPRIPRSDDEYLFAYNHLLRAEDLTEIEDEIHREMERSASILEVLNQERCSVSSEAEPASPDSCLSKVRARVAEVEKFDDLRFWIRLPLPVNALSKEDRELIQSPDGDHDTKRRKYAEALYRHWIERTDRARFRLYKERLSNAQLDEYKKMIGATLANASLQPALQRGDRAAHRGVVELSTRVEPGYNVVVFDRGGGERYDYDVFRRSLDGGDWERIKSSTSCGCRQGNVFSIVSSDSAYELGVVAFANSLGPRRTQRWRSDMKRRFSQPTNSALAMAFQHWGQTSDLSIVVEATPDPFYGKF